MYDSSAAKMDLLPTNSTGMDPLANTMLSDITCAVVIFTLVMISTCFFCIFVRIYQMEEAIVDTGNIIAIDTPNQPSAILVMERPFV